MIENLGQGKPCECLGSDRGNFPGSEAVGTTRQDLNEQCNDDDDDDDLGKRFISVVETFSRSKTEAPLLAR